MRYFFMTLAVVLAACGVSYGTFYFANREAAVREAAREGDAMAWLRAEFQLSDAQYAAIRKLHEEYSDVCAEHCAAIMGARRRAAPAEELARLEEVCVSSMTEHFQRVAAEMSADHGRRYLALVLPRVAAYDHAHAPNLQVTH